jgi:periplasmic copper chaperone A
MWKKVDLSRCVAGAAQSQPQGRHYTIYRCGRVHKLQQFALMRRFPFFFVLLCLLLAQAAHAANEVTVRNAWLRATPPGQSTAGAYFEITSKENAALVAATTPVAQKAELHTMSMAGGIMRMRPMDKIELPADKPVALAPGGLHIMLTGLKQPLKEGERVPLTLTVQPAGRAPFTLNVDAEVRPLGGSAMPMHH